VNNIAGLEVGESVALDGLGPLVGAFSGSRLGDSLRYLGQTEDGLVQLYYGRIQRDMPWVLRWTALRAIVQLHSASSPSRLSVAQAAY